MINVLYICHDYDQLGGAALSLANLIASVKKDVCPVILLRKEGSVADYFISKGYEVIIHDYALNISSNNMVYRLLTYIPRTLRDSVTNKKCTDHVLSQLRGRKIDIVHSNSSVISYGVELAKALGAMHVWHIREYYSVGLCKTPIEGFCRLRQKMRACDATISISKEVERHWKMEGHKNSNVISDAVRSKNDIVWNESKEKYVVFCSAALIPSKGTEEAVELFCKSAVKEQRYTLRLIGKCEDAYRRMLLEIAKEYGAENSIEFLGFQNNIKPILEKAAAFLMCSRFEGLGRVTIEAMFYGCPVLAYNSGGTRSIITDGKNGLMYDNVDDAAEKLKQLVENKDYAQQLSAKAQKDAVESFSEEEYGKRISELYMKILR